MKIVQKWAAGFDYNEELIMVSHDFRQTPKMLYMQKVQDANGRRMQIVLGYQTNFHRDMDEVRLHNTPEEALKALHAKQTRIIRNAQQKIEIAQEHMNKIVNFDLTN